MSGWTAARLDELDSIPLFDGLVWHPVRRRLGITAFGVNAYTAEAAAEAEPGEARLELGGERAVDDEPVAGRRPAEQRAVKRKACSELRPVSSDALAALGIGASQL